MYTQNIFYKFSVQIEFLQINLYKNQKFILNVTTDQKQ